MDDSHCRLFLATPERFDNRKVLDCIVQALKAGDVASLLIRGDCDEKQLSTLVNMTQDNGVAVLIENNVPLAKRLGCDGVEVDGGLTAYAAAREALGPDFIVGVNCHNERHLAMTVAEAGADYVCFTPEESADDDESIVSWWSQLFEVPCVARGAETIDRAGEMIAEGADFVAPPPAMWLTPEATDDTITRINRFMNGR